MIQESLRVTAQTVISQMLEGHKTFADLAPRYGMTEEEFKKVVARVVNDKDFSRLAKVNDKYIVARSRVRKNKIDIQNEKEQKKESETIRKRMSKEFDSKMIFLIAPNYKGAKPEFGTVISAVPMEGAILEDVSDISLIEELSAEEVFLFDNMEEAKAVNAFMKLVTKYFVEDKEYKLLIDNEALIKLLKKQQLIEDPDT